MNLNENFISEEKGAKCFDLDPVDDKFARNACCNANFVQGPLRTGCKTPQK